MLDYQTLFNQLTADSRYIANLDWGEPRPGHPEGTVRAHIAELERNLDRLAPRLTEEERWKLRLLIHAHDSFKAGAEPGSAVGSPGHHGSIAAAFLGEYVPDPELVEMARMHDEPYAIWQRVRNTGAPNQSRLDALLGRGWDWELFSAFLIVDGRTEGKSSDPLLWVLGVLRERGLIERFGPEDAA